MSDEAPCSFMVVRLPGGARELRRVRTLELSVATHASPGSTRALVRAVPELSEDEVLVEVVEQSEPLILRGLT